MLALPQSMESGLFHLRLSSNFLNMHKMRNFWQFQSLGYFSRHILRCTQNKNAHWLSFFNCFAYFLCMTWQHKDRSLYSQYLILLPLGRFTGNYFAVLYQQTIINNGICLVVMGNQKSTMTFSGAAWPH